MTSNKSTPAVEVLGIDRAAEWRRYVREAKAQLEADRVPNLEAREQARRNEVYGIADRIFFVISRQPSREGQPDRYRGEAITGLPDPSMQVIAEGESPDDVLFEARHALISALFTARVEKTWEAARHRAAVAKLEIADLRMEL